MRVVASIVAVALASGGCHTYGGSRTTAIVGGCTLAVGGGFWVANRTFEDPNLQRELKWSAPGPASLGALLVIGGIIGMVSVSSDSEAAAKLANLLVARTHAGGCSAVRERGHEVQELDPDVYDRVLLGDPVVAKCLSGF